MCIQMQCLTSNSRWLIIPCETERASHCKCFAFGCIFILSQRSAILYSKTLSYNYVFIFLYFYIRHKKISTKHSPQPQSSQKPLFSLAFKNKSAIVFRGIVWLIYLLLCCPNEQPVLRAPWCIKQVAKKPCRVISCKLSVLTSIQN